MPALNRIEIIGHLGKDPELVTFGSYSFIKFSVAVSRGKYHNKDLGTDWFNIDCSSKMQWLLNDYHKGDLVFVEGQMKIEQKDNKTFTSIKAFRVLKLNSKYAEEKSPVFGAEEILAEADSDSIPF